MQKQYIIFEFQMRMMCIIQKL